MVEDGIMVVGEMGEDTIKEILPPMVQDIL
jgi:hypothetical protein